MRGIWIFSGVVCGVILAFSINSFAYTLDELKLIGEKHTPTEDINVYEAICRGYQVVKKYPDGSEIATGYGALADQYTYEKTVPVTIVSSTSTKSR